MTEEVFKWNTAYVPVRSSAMAELIKTEHTFARALKAEMDRATADMGWSLQEQERNGHIGPQHRPGRRELHDARENVKRWAKHDQWKRSAGTYRR